ncbi:MAG: iron uptake porin, partial [Cyanobacteria bacterium P01_D01_bin.116]
TFAFPDLGKEGSNGGIIIGQPPKLISNQYQLDREEYMDNDTSLHLEAFYRFKVNDNVAITPGIVVITNPEHNSDNDTIYLGTLRTTFSF